MSVKHQWFSAKSRGSIRSLPSLNQKQGSRPVSNRSTSVSDKSVSFNFKHDWQSGKTLEQCNMHMLKHGILTDVEFFVGSGKRREVINAHKYILASRSSVFFALFADGKQEVISVTDVEPNIFHRFLRFVYSDNVEITAKNVTALLYVAKKYNVGGLIGQCRRYLTEEIDVNTVCTLLEQAHAFKELDLEKSCLNYIYTNAHDVFKTSEFAKLCPTCLTKIIKSDDLKVEESKVYEGLYDWSAHACSKQKLPANADNRRRVLGNLIHLIRFPLLDIDYFVKHVTTQCLLTKEETIQLFQYFHSRTSPSVGPFIARRRALTHVIRFETTSGAWNVGSHVVDSICFQSSKNVTVDGVLVYGCFKDESAYDVSIQIRNEQNQVLVRTDTTLDTNETAEMYDIMLHNGVSIKALTWYTIMLYMDGPQTKRGVCGKNMVYCEQVQFMFHNSGLSQNCTSEREGQIPGFLFH